ncbi:MAG: hypothetical protein AB8B55_17760 [Mariniblastus sp.]
MNQTTEVNRTLRYALLAVFVSVPIANFGLEPLLSDGSQFAEDPQTRVAAAGYAFAIWGVIFTGMLWFSANLAFGNEPDSSPLRKAVVCLMIAGVASIAFVPISIYCNFTVSWIDIMAHLVPLILAAFFLRKHAAELPTASTSKLARWSFFGPSMYLGWICAATVISTSLLGNEWGIKLSDPTATGLAIATVVELGLVAIWMTWNRDPIYGATVCWALIAVGVKQASFPAIQYAAWGTAIAIGLTVVHSFFIKRKSFYTLALSVDDSGN